MDKVLNALEQAAAGNDPDAIEEAIYQAYENGLVPEFADVFVRLLAIDWHFRHEDVVRAIQQLKPPHAVDLLYETANKQYEYLGYDEFFGLARKCTWALADIGTAEAYGRLQQLARSDNPLIAGYAQKRLDNWEEEASRKGI